MFLVDTDVISESRKGPKANSHVRRFFDVAAKESHGLYLSVVTIGELRRGVELLRHRNDIRQARRLGAWLANLLEEYADHILDFTSEAAQRQLRFGDISEFISEFISESRIPRMPSTSKSRRRPSSMTSSS
jgi:predicted nucleic acid-binding protein